MNHIGHPLNPAWHEEPTSPSALPSHQHRSQKHGPPKHQKPEAQEMAGSSRTRYPSWMSHHTLLFPKSFLTTYVHTTDLNPAAD